MVGALSKLTNTLSKLTNTLSKLVAVVMGVVGYTSCELVHN